MATPASEAAHAAAAAQGTADAKPPLVLVVDDEPSHRAMIQRGLAESGRHYRAVTAGCLAEAIAATQKRRFDLILADLRLPDGDGMELITRCSGQPVIVMTAQGDEYSAVAAMRAGAIDYVIKSPHTLGDIGRIMDRALRERAVADRARELPDQHRRLALEWERTFAVIGVGVAVIPLADPARSPPR